ncbi:MAG: gliding motility lipoprotein GldH [Cyclobacteriaceae bacterium]
MKYILIFVLGVCLISCDQQRLFEENHNVDAEFWYVDSLMVFNFEIDENATPYNIYSNFTHTSDYTYYNLYYRYSLRDSTDKEVNADLVNIHFFDPKTGAPLGSGLGDVFDHQQLILENYKFENPGAYSISFQQYMRTDSLPNIAAVGARVELATAE